MSGSQEQKKKICVIDLTFFSWSGHKHFTEPSNSPSHTCLTDELSLRVSLHRSNRSEREPEPAQTNRSSLSKAVTRVILHRQGQRKLAWRVWSQGMRSSSSSTTTEHKMRTKRCHFLQKKCLNYLIPASQMWLFSAFFSPLRKTKSLSCGQNKTFEDIARRKSDHHHFPPLFYFKLQPNTCFSNSWGQNPT